MNETFTSVLLFHTALKNFLIASFGLTVERTLGENDVILTNGASAFLRIQKKTDGSTTSIGIEVEASADALEISTKDPAFTFPFDTTSGGAFHANIRWNADLSCVNITLYGSGDRYSVMYSANLTLVPLALEVLHADPLNHAIEPNFKELGGAYVQAGV